MNSLITARQRRDARPIHTSPMAIAVLIDRVPNTIGFSTHATDLRIPAVDNYLLKYLPFISCHQWSSIPTPILVTLCHRTRYFVKASVS
ncbi:hypothetical protein CEXT_371431 [Caerostris extrusa]|uniref:Uncharacterized protein n=1 Tax=Caerostris extrusa TaxID=172846 RepID=A0AAV4R7P9_CAEEX|nr:hypothetical protein CEXT_371431 [Caerostris extrusa]